MIFSMPTTFACGECGKDKHRSEQAPNGHCWDCYADSHIPCDECGTGIPDADATELGQTCVYLCPACYELECLKSAPNH